MELRWQQHGLWYTYNTKTDRVLAYTFRLWNDETCRELLALLTPFCIGMVPNDDWAVTPEKCQRRNTRPAKSSRNVSNVTTRPSAPALFPDFSCPHQQQRLTQHLQRVTDSRHNVLVGRNKTQVRFGSGSRQHPPHLQLQFP